MFNGIEQLDYCLPHLMVVSSEVRGHAVELRLAVGLKHCGVKPEISFLIIRRTKAVADLIVNATHRPMDFRASRGLLQKRKFIGRIAIQKRARRTR